MVQVLADLDLVISKSYISSDGDWFMDGKSSASSSSHVIMVDQLYENNI